MAGEHMFTFHANLNEELEQEFLDFFDKYNLTSLFTNEHRAGDISVSYLDIRSVLNPGNTYHKTLLQMGDLLQIGSDNKMYENAVFRIIYEARSFGTMMKNIKRINEYEVNRVTDNKRHNLWNIVWYNKELQ